MEAFERLAQLFEKFPGIGPRQSMRFVHYLMRIPPHVRKEIAEGIATLDTSVRTCSECGRYFEGKANVCSWCGDTGRTREQLMIVATDVDANAIERSHSYKGTYFILGGLCVLGKDEQKHLRKKTLETLLKKRSAENLSEIILAFPANPEGDTTAHYVIGIAAETVPQVSVSVLGRGLSTGSELEYADPDTLRNALINRKKTSSAIL